MKFPRFGEYKDVVVEDIVLLPRARVLLDYYQIKLAFSGKDKEGKAKKWEQIIPVVDLFTKGGMLTVMTREFTSRNTEMWTMRST